MPAKRVPRTMPEVLVRSQDYRDDLIEHFAFSEAVLLRQVEDITAETIRDWERQGRLSALRTIRGVRLFTGSDVLRLQRERSTNDLPAPTEAIAR